MSVRIGVNGFGRIGKGCVRAALAYPEIEIAAINSNRDPQMLAHLLQYDSTYGPLKGDIRGGNGFLSIDGKKIPLLSERDLSRLDWSSVGADVVLESTGAFNNRQKAAEHLQGGAKKVIITAPAKDADLTVVMGVNHSQYNPAKHDVISNASCTTNCLAPVIKVLHESFGVEEAFMTTVHAYTNDQRLLDGSHKDWRRARAGALSMIPTTTGAAKAVGLVIPDLDGKINGLAVRVPTPTVSLVDLVARVKENVTVDMLNETFSSYAEKELKGILAVESKPLVSVDFKGNNHSAIVDAPSTMILGEKMVKVLAWYDNEWGYISRVLDLAAYVGNAGH